MWRAFRFACASTDEGQALESGSSTTSRLYHVPSNALPYGRNLKAMRYLLLLLAAAGPAWTQCRVRDPGTGRSQLQVELALTKGRLVAVRKPNGGLELPQAARTPQFKESTEFTTGMLDDAAKAAITAQLLDWLDPVLTKMEPFYRYFLTDDQRALDDQSQFTEQTSVVRALTANSLDTVSAFSTWLQTVRPGVDFGQTAEQQLQHLPNLGLDTETPMLHADFSADSGAAIGCFNVDDLVDPSTLTTGANALVVQFLPDPPSRQSLLTKEEVVRWITSELKSTKGFWVQNEIQTHFLNLYADIGLQPAVFASPLQKRPRYIHILESARVRTIMFPLSFNLRSPPADPRGAGSTAPPDVNLAMEKIVYTILPTEEFRRFQTSQVIFPPPPREGASQMVGPTLSMSAVTGVSSDSDLPLLDLLILGDTQANLQPLGYTLSVSQDSSGDGASAEVNPFVDFVVTVQGQAPAPPGANTPAPPAPRARMAGTAEPGSGKTGALKSSNPAAITPPPMIQPTFGLQYRPGQGVRVLGAAQFVNLHLLSPNGSVSWQGGTDTTHPLGALNINDDYLFFDALGRRRLSFNAQANSDVVSKRQLAGQEVDQRTTGATAHTELDLFRDLRGYLLRWTAEAQYQVVSLERSGSNEGLGQKHLTTVDTGLLFGYASEASALPVRIQLEPHFKYDLGLANAEPVWRQFLLLGNWHQRLSDSQILSLEVAGRAISVSRGTPIFELPALGGADTVRGFRQDSALGHKLWSLQPEFWAPAPTTVTPKDDDKIRQFLRKNIRLAAFMDVGGIYDTTLPTFGGASLAAQKGIRIGPGAGLRFLRGSIALKLDWAYGLGGGPNGGGHGRFYIGVSKYGF